MESRSEDTGQPYGNNRAAHRPPALRRRQSSIVSGQIAPFETLLEEHVGAYGRWQHQISFLNILLTINAGAQAVSYPMITGQFDYQCVDDDENYNSTLISTTLSSARADQKHQCTSADGTRPCTAWKFSSDDFGPAMVSEFALVCSRTWLAALVHTSFTIGCGVGVLLFGWLSDRLGRRYVMRATIPLMIFTNFALVFVPEIWTTLVLRFFQGILVFGNFTVIYVLSMETTLPRRRAFVGNLVHIPWGLNFMFTAAAAAWLPNWRWTQFVISSPSLLCLVVYLPRFVPESPRWLLLQEGREAEAFETLLHASKLNRKGKRKHRNRPASPGSAAGNDSVLRQEISFRVKQLSSSRILDDHSAEQEMDEMTMQPLNPNGKRSGVLMEHDAVSNHHVVERTSNRGSETGILSLFRTPRIRYHTLLILVIWFQGAMTNHGINFYVPRMAENPFISYALVGVGETLSPAVGAFVFRIGRRVPIAITYFLGALVSLALLPVVHWAPSQIGLIALGVLATFLSDMAFNGIYVHTSELMPTVLRNTGLGLASSAARVGSAGVSFIVAWREQIWWMPPVVFAVGMFAGTVCTLLLPSTDDCIMPETVQDVEDGFEKVKIGKKAKQQQLDAVVD